MKKKSFRGTIAEDEEKAKHLLKSTRTCPRTFPPLINVTVQAHQFVGPDPKKPLIKDPLNPDDMFKAANTARGPSSKAPRVIHLVWANPPVTWQDPDPPSPGKSQAPLTWQESGLP